jgi:hypothetical protein
MNHDRNTVLHSVILMDERPILLELTVNDLSKMMKRFSNYNIQQKVLKRCRPYVVLERKTLDKLARKHRKQGNIQNWIVGSYFTFKE